MALQNYEYDLIINVGQKYGYDIKMKYLCLISNHITKSLSIQWSVYFVNENGEEVTTQIINSFTKEQVANNSTYLNPLTGEFLTEPVDLETTNAIGEYDFYWQLVNMMDTNLPNLILSAGERFKTKILEMI